MIVNPIDGFGRTVLTDRLLTGETPRQVFGDAETHPKRPIRTASGAATRLSRAPIFVSARGAPVGKAAVAKKSATVKPIEAATPTTRRSPSRSPEGRLAPARRAALVNNK